MGGVEVGARLCDQNPCRERATVYAMDRLAGGWAGYYDCNKLDNNAIVGKHPKMKNVY